MTNKKHLLSRDYDIQLFPYGVPVTGSDLIGRKDDVQTILREIGGGQNLLLPGSRRIGKTSVVLECLDRFRKMGWNTAYIDISGVNSPKGLAQEIAAAIIGSGNSKLRRLMRSFTTKVKDLLQFKEFKVAYQNIELVATLRDPNASEIDMLKASFDLIEQYGKGKKIVCAFDEFGELMSLDESIVKLMRSKFQHHKHCVYIFLGSQESILRQMFSNRKEPFFGFCKEIHLSPIPNSEFVSYLISQFKKANMSLTENIANRMCELTHAHPYYTKVLANHLYEYAVIRKINKIDNENDLSGAFGKAFESLRYDMEKIWFDLGPGIARTVCIYLTLYGSKYIFSMQGLKKDIDSARIAQALNGLEIKGVVRKIEPGNYQFENPFFKQYIRFQYDPKYPELIDERKD